MNEGELRPTTPELRLQDMDRDGVDATVIYGPTDPFSADDPEVRYELYRGYNDWLESFTAACPERLIGASQLPLDDPAAAAKEMERVAKLGSRHVNLMASRADPPIWHESWDPFWSIAEESAIPVGSHIAVLTFNRPEEKPRYSHPAVERAVGGYRVNSQLVEPVCGLIFGGVFDRHPTLKFVMGESDLAWISYIWSRTPNDPPAPGGPKLPTREYFKRQIWMTFIQDSAGVEMVKAGIFEPDKAMWSSDYPHPASSWPKLRRFQTAAGARVRADLLPEFPRCGDRRLVVRLFASGSTRDVDQHLVSGATDQADGPGDREYARLASDVGFARPVKASVKKETLHGS